MLSRASTRAADVAIIVSPHEGQLVNAAVLADAVPADRNSLGCIAGKGPWPSYKHMAEQGAVEALLRNPGWRLSLRRAEGRPRKSRFVSPRCDSDVHLSAYGARAYSVQIGSAVAAACVIIGLINKVLSGAKIRLGGVTWVYRSLIRQGRRQQSGAGTPSQWQGLA